MLQVLKGWMGGEEGSRMIQELRAWKGVAEDS